MPALNQALDANLKMQNSGNNDEADPAAPGALQARRAGPEPGAQAGGSAERKSPMT